MNQLIGIENKPTFYVVTRDGRRAWPKDYWTISEAQDHVDSLMFALRNYEKKIANTLTIVETTDPESIN